MVLSGSKGRIRESFIGEIVKYLIEGGNCYHANQSWLDYVDTWGLVLFVLSSSIFGFGVVLRCRQMCFIPGEQSL
jgi:hypothetical protein